MNNASSSPCLSAGAPYCVGIAIVRNEIDVIELWARYNLRLLDELHVIDHLSRDRTVWALQQLQAEGLPVRLLRWDDPAHTQAEAMNWLAAGLAARRDVDFLVPLDADELLAVADRPAFHAALRAIPAGCAGAMLWRTYLPAGDGAGPDDAAFFRRMTRYRSKEPRSLAKLILPAALCADYRWSTGNHNAFHRLGGTPVPRVDLPFALAHYPVRGQVQLQRKVLIGAHAARLKARRPAHESWHWLKLAGQIQAAPGQSAGLDLQRIALAYSFEEGVTEQSILDGAVPDDPALEQCYPQPPASLDEVRAWLAASEAEHAALLGERAAESFNRANAAFRAGDRQLALDEADAALVAQPDLEAAALLRARCLVKLGRLLPAREAFARTLRLNPANFSAWLEAGHLCRQMGELAQAVGAYRRAIGAAPQRYEAPLALTRCLELQGEHGLAGASYRQALEAAARLGPQAARQVHQHVARYRLERGDTPGARQALQAALAMAAQDGADEDEIAGLRIDLADALLRDGARGEALALLTAASAAGRESTLTRLAELSFRHNLWQEAIAVSRRNVERHPANPWVRWNLAHLLAECWQMEEAETVLAEAEALAPMPGAGSMRAAIAGRRGDADTALALYRQLALSPGAPPSAASSAAMSSLYSDQLGAQEVAGLHRALFAKLGEGARPRASFARPPLAGRRLRLGIVSADFHHQHPVNIFLQPVLRELDRSRFEVFLYFTGVTCDEQTRLAATRVEHWREASALNDAQLARQIDADAIDLLLDLAGHTGQQRMRLFARRAAPVQATYLGYPGSTGVPNIDWMLGDAVVTPAGCEALYTERIARLPGTVFCYAPEADYPYPDYTEAHARRPLTFGCFNNVPKLTPKTLRLWAAVLRALPDARLLLKAPSFGDPGALRLFGERLAALGVDPARVELRGPTGLAQMMAEYAEVDIALDTLPYNGGTTSLQAMWMGVPLITLEGSHFVSRMGASFLRAAGLAEWVARDAAGYVAIACAMAADRAALLELKRGLRQRLLARPGWDVRAHTRAMEAALLTMAQDAAAPG